MFLMNFSVKRNHRPMMVAESAEMGGLFFVDIL